MKTNIDLFAHLEELPLELTHTINRVEDKHGEINKDFCEELIIELHKIGYTCEFGLDFQPYNLHKLETTNETPEEMKTTENIVFEHENKQVIQKGNHFFTRVTENGESFESVDFNTIERAKESLGIVPTTEEKNILIAEFLGFQLTDLGWFDSEEVLLNIERDNTFDNLKFNSDWNWLIPTIEKCREAQIFGSQRLIDNIDKRLLKLDLLATYENVVDFITWHNQQKN